VGARWPGLIDCHIHALASALSVQLVELQVEACRAAHGLRMGAHCIKIMGSSGVVSPTAPCWMTQYREDEIRAIVQECEARRTCATAHCHPASAIRRCIEFGVTRIEHGSLIDAETARFAAERGAHIAPTLVTAVALMETGRELGKSALGTDLILVDGDPLQDIDPLAQDGQCLSLIARAGAIIRNRL